jgi:hypothetical protein
VPTIKTESGANVIQTLNVNSANYPGESMPDVPNPLTSSNLLAIAQGLDHERQLEAVDLSVQDGIVTDGPPVAQYAFENDVLDMTANNNGTNKGATFVDGAVGSFAAQFDGAKAYVEIPKSVTANFSIAMWVRTTDTGSAGPWYAGKGLVDGAAGKDASGFGTALNSGRFSLGIGHPDTTLTSTVAVNDGAWHHVVATRNATSGAMRIYIDGVLNGDKKGPAGIRDAMPGLRIGSIQSGAATGFLNGAIDQVQIYDYVLTQDEIASIYHHTQMLIPASAVATHP